MLSPEHQELLSAHFDGELAAEERAQVDALLNESQEAREVLQEFDEISAALRDIDVPVTPDGLRANVLERIAKTAPAAPQPRSRRPAWQRWLAPALAASLALVVAVWIQVRPPAPPTTAPMADATMGDAMTTAPEPGSVDFGAAGMEAATTEGLNSLAFSSEMSGMSAGDEMLRLERFSAPEASDAGTALSSRLFPDGSRPVPGETRALLGQQGEAPVLVNYTVVDVEKAAGRMRVLLSQNGIHEVAADASATENEESAPGRELLEENRMFALYVEAPQDQVVAALNDFDTIREVVDVDADYVAVSNNLGVEADALPYRMQQKWKAAGQSRARGRPVAETPAPTSAPEPFSGNAGEPARPLRRQSVDAPKPADAAVRESAVGGGSEGATGRGEGVVRQQQLKRNQGLGRGVQMQVSEADIEKLMRPQPQQQAGDSYRLALPTPPPRPPAPPEPEPLDSESSEPEPGLTGRRVKVILILQDQSEP